MAFKKFPISLRELEVVAVRDVSPRLRRITFGGAQMGAFTSSNGHAIPPFASEGPDDHVKMFFTDPRSGQLVLPEQAEGHLHWPSSPKPTAREYTPRGYKAGDRTCDFEFVLHGHGVASTWAAKAKPGDRLFFAGPKSSMVVPEADWYLLTGDETALPAIANWLEMLPTTARVHCVILIEDPAARLDLPAPQGARIDWVADDHARPEILRDAVAALALSASGRGFVWGAGEREQIRLLRAHLLEERKFEKSQVDVSAYWHNGVDDDAVDAAYDAFEALADLSGPFALRAAASLGLAEHVQRGAASLARLAEVAGCDPEMLAALLPILIEKNVLTGTPERLGLGPLGLILAEDDHSREHLDLNAAAGRRGLAWAGLLDGLKGKDAYARIHGRAYAADATAPELAQSFAHEHGHLLEDAFEDAAKQIVLPPGARVIDVEGGEGGFLREVIARHADATGTLVEQPAALGGENPFAGHLEAARLAVTPQSADAPLPARADAYLLGGALMRRDDAGAVQRLAEVAAAMAPSSRLFVVEPAAPDEPRWWLELRLALGAPRPHDAIAALAAQAGLAQVRRIGLPDGHVLFEFATI